jgi:hypothetical protein
LTPLLSLRTEEVAQIYQQDGSDLQEAMNAYEKAGEWYSSEDANAWVVLHSPVTHAAVLLSGHENRADIGESVLFLSAPQQRQCNVQGVSRPRGAAQQLPARHPEI